MFLRIATEKHKSLMVDRSRLKMLEKLIDKNQAYFWTNNWQEKEKKADEDIKAGRVKAFDSVEELIKELKDGN